MNIVIISTIDTRGGGSKIPWNLMQRLRARGHEVSMFVGTKHSRDPKVYAIPKNPLYYRLSTYLANDLTFSLSDGILKTPTYRQADIVHFHNTHSGFFNWSTFEKIVSEKPAVWTAHDLWPLTSGCTTSLNCREDRPRRFLGLWDNRPYLLKEKRRVYDASTFTMVAPSTWMEQQMAQSVLKHKPRRMIANGIDTDLFVPRDKREVRKELALPINERIALFIANGGIHNRFKGGDVFLDIARRWPTTKPTRFIAIGNRHQTKREDIGNLITLGNIDDEQELARYYAAADVFVYPTLADSFGLVVAESMACGTPVVAYATDGVPETIANLGHVVPQGDVAGLEQGINEILMLPATNYASRATACRSRVVEQYSLTRMVDEYEETYRAILQAS